MYKMLTSIEKIKATYKDYMERTTDVEWKLSSLKQRVGQLMIKNITKNGLGGLNLHL